MFIFSVVFMAVIKMEQLLYLILFRIFIRIRYRSDCRISFKMSNSRHTQFRSWNGYREQFFEALFRFLTSETTFTKPLF